MPGKYTDIRYQILEGSICIVYILTLYTLPSQQSRESIQLVVIQFGMSSHE